MAVALPFIGLGLTLASTGYAIYSGEKQKDAAQDAMERQEAQAKAFQQEMQQRQAQQDEQANQQAMVAMNRQRAIASGYQKAGQTTFTSPLGLPGGGASTTGSTLGL